MKLAKETLHVTLYSLYSGTPKLWLGLQFFIKEESRTAVFKILVRTLLNEYMYLYIFIQIADILSLMHRRKN